MVLFYWKFEIVCQRVGLGSGITGPNQTQPTICRFYQQNQPAQFRPNFSETNPQLHPLYSQAPEIDGNPFSLSPTTDTEKNNSSPASFKPFKPQVQIKKLSSLIHLPNFLHLLPKSTSSSICLLAGIMWTHVSTHGYRGILAAGLEILLNLKGNQGTIFPFAGF